MNGSSLRSRIEERLRTLPDRHGGWGVIAGLCAIVALGVGLRAYYAVERTEGVQEDSIKYYDLAEALYLDGRYDAPAVERDDAYHPGSPLFHAGVWYLTGGVHPQASRLLAALLSSVMIVCVYLLARRLASAADAAKAASRRRTTDPAAAEPEGRSRRPEVIGLIAALLIAVDASSIDFYRSHMNEPLASIVLVASVLAFLWAGDRSSPWACALPGALIGLTALFRPEALAYGAALAVLALVLAWRGRGRSVGLAAAGALALGIVVAIAPWTIRNAIALDRFVPVSEGTGNALFIGSYLPANGDHFQTFDRREQLLAEEAPGLTAAERDRVLSEPDLTLGDVLAAIAAERYPDRSTDEALAKLGRDELEDDLTEHPLDYAGMLADKTWNMWGQAAAAKPRQGGPGAGGDIYHLVLVALGLVGLVVLAIRRRWEALVIGTILGLATLIGAVLLAPPRRNVDLLPIVAAIAAVGAVWLADRLRQRVAEGSADVT